MGVSLETVQEKHGTPGKGTWRGYDDCAVAIHPPLSLLGLH